MVCLGCKVKNSPNNAPIEPPKLRAGAKIPPAPPFVNEIIPLNNRAGTLYHSTVLSDSNNYLSNNKLPAPTLSLLV